MSRKTIKDGNPAERIQQSRARKPRVLWPEELGPHNDHWPDPADDLPVDDLDWDGPLPFDPDERLTINTEAMPYAVYSVRGLLLGRLATLAACLDCLDRWAGAEYALFGGEVLARKGGLTTPFGELAKAA